MTFTMDQMAAAYAKIKDARAARKAEFERIDAEMEEDQRKLRVYMLQTLNAVGGNSVNTPNGTVYRTKKVKASAADWSAIWNWMKETDNPELLERRIKVKFVTDYMEAHDDALPPGINIHTEFDVAVRKPTN